VATTHPRTVRPTRRRAASALGAALVAAALAVAGCAGGGEPASTAPPAETVPARAYLPGLDAFPHVPDARGRAPVVVMVPGGGWSSADPSGYAGLATRLAAGGVVAVPVEIRAAEDGVTYPVPVEDVLCALAFGAVAARSAGVEPSALVLLGHSSGAHLSMLAALGTVEPAASCPHPAVRADAVAGLAGPYDIAEVPDLAEPLFGVTPEEDPALWEAANPVRQAARRPEVAALLLHGGRDDIVPTSFSEVMAAALEDSGHPTELRLFPDADHQSIYSAEVAAEPVLAWLRGLAPSSSPTTSG
jgi:acetyl esterase/lipase